jgi:hypothetical protein
MSYVNNYYVIYKGTGGLIHMLSGLVFCIDYCIKFNNILIIDVISHICFKHYLNDFFIINCPSLTYSEDYSLIEPKNLLFARSITIDYIKNYPNVEKIEMHDGQKIMNYRINNIIIKKSLGIIPTKSKLNVYAGFGKHDFLSIIKYLKVKPEILEIIKQKEQINNYIGVHFRNTDIKNNFNEIVNLIKKHNYNTIYLATDDYNAYNQFKNALPNHNIYQYTIPINSNGEPIHYKNPDKYNLILNILIDLYFLYKANEFINSNWSLVSKFVSAMRNEKKSIFD